MCSGDSSGDFVVVACQQILYSLAGTVGVYAASKPGEVWILDVVSKRLRYLLGDNARTYASQLTAPIAQFPSMARLAPCLPKSQQTRFDASYQK